MFDEPGVLGTLSAFILYGNRYDFKNWYVKIIFVGGIFTYSLAFYILTAVGYAFLCLRNLKNILSTIVVILLMLIVFIFFMSNNEVFQASVVERLADSEESMDSRTGYYTEKKLKTIKWSGDFFLGLGNAKMNELDLFEGQSYKLFLLNRGLLAMIVLFFCYYSFMRRKNLENILLLLLYIASFVQRPFAFTSWQMLLFCCISCYLDKAESNVLK